MIPLAIRLLREHWQTIAVVMMWASVVIGGLIYKHLADQRESQLEVCKANSAATQEIIKANEVKYQENMKSYESALKATVAFYDDKLDEIDNFKEDIHETKCENAQRLFDGFRY